MIVDYRVSDHQCLHFASFPLSSCHGNRLTITRNDWASDRDTAPSLLQTSGFPISLEDSEVARRLFLACFDGNLPALYSAAAQLSLLVPLSSLLLSSLRLWRLLRNVAPKLSYSVAVEVAVVVAFLSSGPLKRSQEESLAAPRSQSFSVESATRFPQKQTLLSTTGLCHVETENWEENSIITLHFQSFFGFLRRLCFFFFSSKVFGEQAAEKNEHSWEGSRATEKGEIPDLGKRKIWELFDWTYGWLTE